MVGSFGNYFTLLGTVDKKIHFSLCGVFGISLRTTYSHTDRKVYRRTITTKGAVHGSMHRGERNGRLEISTFAVLMLSLVKSQVKPSPLYAGFIAAVRSYCTSTVWYNAYSN